LKNLKRHLRQRTVKTDPDEILDIKNDKHQLYPHEEEKEALLFIKGMSERNLELISGPKWTLSLGNHEKGSAEQ
jgi:hypothetical protein